MNRFGRWPLAGALLGCWLLASGPAHAQPAPPAPEVPWEGFQAFKFLLLANGLQPASSFEDIASHQAAPRSIIISFGGDGSELGGDPEALRTYLRRGGMAFIATDRTTGPLLLRAFGVRVNGGYRRARRPAQGYLGKPECPFVRVSRNGVGPLVGNLRRIATNVPSSIELTPNLPDALGVRRPWAYLPGVMNDAQAGSEASLFGVLTKEWGPENAKASYALILADQSIFINGMMLPSAHAGNDNLAFASAIIRWLKAAGGERSSVLYMENGQVVTDFNNLDDWLQSLNNPPVPRVPDLPTPPVAVMNTLLQGLEQENFFNRMLLDNVPYKQIIARVGGTLAVCVVLYCIYRATRARDHTEPRDPVFASEVAAANPLATPTELRRQAMIREGALWELARKATRHAFLRFGFAEADFRAPPPRVDDSGPSRHRRARLENVQHLWSIAQRETPRPLTPAQFSAIIKQIHDLETAVADGTLQVSRNQEPA